MAISSFVRKKEKKDRERERETEREREKGQSASITFSRIAGLVLTCPGLFILSDNFSGALIHLGCVLSAISLTIE